MEFGVMGQGVVEGRHTLPKDRVSNYHQRGGIQSWKVFAKA